MTTTMVIKRRNASAPAVSPVVASVNGVNGATTVNAPTGIALGDLLAAWVFDTGGSSATRTGWTAHVSAAGSRVSFLTKVADSGDAAAGSFAFSGTTGYVLIAISRVTGAGTLEAVTSGGGNSATANVPSLVPTVANGLFLIGIGADNTSIGSPSPGTWTLDRNEGGILKSFSLAYSTATATGAITASVASGPWGATGIVVKPA